MNRGLSAAPLPADVQKSARLQAQMAQLLRAAGRPDTELLLSKLDYHSSLATHNLGWVEARIVCAQAAAEIRRLQQIIAAHERD